MPKTKRKGGSAKIDPLSREHFTFRKVSGESARCSRCVREQDRSRRRAYTVVVGIDAGQFTVCSAMQVMKGSILGAGIGCFLGSVHRG